MRRMMTQTDPVAVKTLRDRVLAAFGRLRKQGVVARANFMCCMGCATGGLEPIVKKANAQGAVYWHRQDEEALHERGELTIGFGDLTGDREPMLKIGTMLVDALKAEGIMKINWNGSPDERVEVAI